METITYSRFIPALMLATLACADHSMYAETDSSSKKCSAIEHCDSPNCYTLTSPYCTACKQGYKLENGICSSSLTSFCANYTETSTGDWECTGCNAGYVLYTRTPGKKECISCSHSLGVAGCKQCEVGSSGRILCTKCDDDKALHTSKLECRSCPDSLCAKCDYDYTKDQTVCTQCKANAAMNANKKCYSCGNGCDGCTFSAGSTGTTPECTNCTAKFALTSTKQCIPCVDNESSDKCTACTVNETTADVCTQCSDGYAVNNAKDGCIRCSSIDNRCSSCRAVDATNNECTVCSKSGSTLYLLSDSGQDCIACPSNCDDCFTIGLCNRCRDGFALSKDKTKCIACDSSVTDRKMDQCATCSSSAGNDVMDRCSECKPGWHSQQDNKGCLECTDTMPGCNNCTFNSSSTVAKLEICYSCKAEPGIYEYALKADLSGCTACRKIDRCTSCTDSNSDNIPECTMCESGYSPSPDKTSCLKDCHSDCTACVRPGLHCSQCEAGYVLSKDHLKCEIGCLECQNSTMCSTLKDMRQINTCSLAASNHACLVSLSTVGGKEVYSRSCGNSTCSSSDTLCKQVTINGESIQECTKCCTGHLCNIYDVIPSGQSRKGYNIWLLIMLVTGKFSFF